MRIYINDIGFEVTDTQLLEQETISLQLCEKLRLEIVALPLQQQMGRRKFVGVCYEWHLYFAQPDAMHQYLE